MTEAGAEPAAPDTVRRAVAAVALVVVLLLARLASAPAARSPDGMSIAVCGMPCSIGTRVVLWREPGGYDAHRLGKFFSDEQPPDGKLRYSPLRGSLPDAIAARAAASGLTLDDLKQVVHQFVLHYDEAGCARQCFKVLQDVRTLSVHFLLDVDGTIYQTLDLREKAWHATIANDGSVGVEIAHPGAYPQPMSAPMAVWYEKDELGWRQRFPKWLTETGVRTPDFVARPDRPDIVAGLVQGRVYHQLDFTPQQYAALARLCAGLARVFPRIRLDVPRNADGSVVDHVLPKDELLAFDGIVGHFHVQQNKQDPGPALQWERLLRDARALVAP
jgi:N-acetyl-anhydromuramyl-L-alanine amidase AmpD